MIIKTITCHNAYNAGAELQSYALATYLKKFSNDVEIINYIPPYLRHYKLLGVNNNKFNRPFLKEAYQLAKLPGRVKARFSRRKSQYDVFTKKYLPVTKHEYTSNEELKAMPPKADIIFAGSDQIWNSIFQNGRDPAFYLDFASRNCIKASYAASFATDEIAVEWHDRMKNWIKNLDYISVRESSGLEILKQLGITKGEQTVDPVFLLEREHWERLCPQLDIHTPYILLYDFDKNEKIAKYTRELADKNHWKLYSIFKCSGCDLSFDQEGPLTFLALLRNAQFIISNSFHATVFSLIFEKNFMVFDRNEKLNVRMRDLLKLTNLEDRLLVDGLYETPSAIDFSIVRLKLTCEIEKSKDFINKVINGVSRND